jgi:hypothetical protein
LFAEFSFKYSKVFHGVGELVCKLLVAVGCCWLLLVAVGDGGKGGEVGVCSCGKESKHFSNLIFFVGVWQAALSLHQLAIALAATEHEDGLGL